VQALFSPGAVYAKLLCLSAELLQGSGTTGKRGGVTVKKLLETLYILTPESYVYN
jgi:hypothetical protein